MKVNSIKSTNDVTTLPFSHVTGGQFDSTCDRDRGHGRPADLRGQEPRGAHRPLEVRKGQDPHGRSKQNHFGQKIRSSAR